MQKIETVMISKSAWAQVLKVAAKSRSGKITASAAQVEVRKILNTFARDEENSREKLQR